MLSTAGLSEDSWSSDEQSDDQTEVIQGPTGSVRGRRHCVRKSVRALLQVRTVGKVIGHGGEIFLCPQDEEVRLRELVHDEEKVVVYTTSMGVIRGTFEACRKVR